jgi:hypothetical protein
MTTTATATTTIIPTTAMQYGRNEIITKIMNHHSNAFIARGAPSPSTPSLKQNPTHHATQKLRLTPKPKPEVTRPSRKPHPTTAKPGSSSRHQEKERDAAKPTDEEKERERDAARLRRLVLTARAGVAEGRRRRGIVESGRTEFVGALCGNTIYGVFPGEGLKATTLRLEERRTRVAARPHPYAAAYLTTQPVDPEVKQGEDGHGLSLPGGSGVVCNGSWTCMCDACEEKSAEMFRLYVDESQCE